ncbi:MAG: NAD+ synthase [Actinomycetota bacterium]|nr:NAD+ synthase [Actinomycetota bacterium]
MSASAPVLRLALAQVNPTVGDVEGNALIAAESIAAARGSGAHLVVLPELMLSGYPPEDLLLKEHFLDACDRSLAELAAGVEGIVALVGCPLRAPALQNGLAVLARGAIEAVYRKVLLPNYGVFDERRYFEPGPGGELLDLGGIPIGLTICEDVWLPGPPTSVEARSGAVLVVNASASPYHRGKGIDREAMVAERALENGVAMALCNTVGGQDELVFDGHSVVVDAAGKTLARAGQFTEELLVCDLRLPARAEPAISAELARPAPVVASIDAELGVAGPAEPRIHEPLADLDEVYAALVLGLGDYARKNGFDHGVLGLSGGIDSALVALIAADALGPERVSCVIMPSPHSSSETQGDARSIARNLGCDAIELEIAPLMEAYEQALAERFAGTEPGVAEENLQSRIRGNLVMALSNKLGWLPLSTGNKSEMSVGYATLYGDMAGGFAVIKDVPKLLVYALVENRNRRAGIDLIPASAIERPPSAELRPDQLDTDSLPPYEQLDAALAAYVERDGSREQMIDLLGIDPEIADRVIGLVNRAEYKRRQAPPGVKITTKAFGRDRRLPITNRFEG